jgi:hypothetical protein
MPRTTLHVYTCTDVHLVVLEWMHICTSVPSYPGACRVPQQVGLDRTMYIYRVGQNHIYTVFIRYFWQGNHQIYGHIRCIYTVLANPIYIYTVYIRCFWQGNHQIYCKYTVIYGAYIRLWPSYYACLRLYWCTFFCTWIDAHLSRLILRTYNSWTYTCSEAQDMHAMWVCDVQLA